jgi:class 3 adenylate cyclase
LRKLGWRPRLFLGLDASAGDDPAPPRMSNGSSADTRAEDQALGSGQGQGEHRQITAMFCDIVGSTRLGVELGAEGLQEAVQRFRVHSVPMRSVASTASSRTTWAMAC